MKRDILKELSFFNGKRVFITGHTGFKGTWLCRVLIDLGAIVTGYALKPLTEVSLFELSGIKEEINHNIGDIRNFKNLAIIMKECQPEIVIHLAAQPIVKYGYENPRDTYEINVMGCVNLLECIRNMNCVKSVLNVTTDKVYLNHGYDYIYKEENALDGFDPYSNSKSCSELITHTYRRSYLAEKGIAVSTARAGNVIGGGDFTKGRIIPDCIYSVMNNKNLVLRNPNSIRPYQHVLETLFAYLLICYKQYENNQLASEYNIAPQSCDCKTTKEMVNIFEKKWGQEISCIDNTSTSFHEDKYLRLNCSKINKLLGWNPVWNIDTGIEKVVEWTLNWIKRRDIRECMREQIDEYKNTLTCMMIETGDFNCIS